MKRQIMHQCSRVCRGVWAAFSNIIFWGKVHGQDDKFRPAAVGQGGPDQDAGLQRRISDDRRNAQGRGGRDCRKGGRRDGAADGGGAANGARQRRQDLPHFERQLRGQRQNRSVEPQFPYVRLYAGVGRYHTQGQPRDAHPFRASQWLRPYGRHDGYDHMGRKKGELVLPKSPSRR